MENWPSGYAGGPAAGSVAGSDAGGRVHMSGQGTPFTQEAPGSWGRLDPQASIGLPSGGAAGHSLRVLEVRVCFPPVPTVLCL